MKIDAGVEVGIKFDQKCLDLRLIKIKIYY